MKTATGLGEAEALSRGREPTEHTNHDAKAPNGSKAKDSLLSPHSGLFARRASFRGLTPTATCFRPIRGGGRTAALIIFGLIAAIAFVKPVSAEDAVQPPDSTTAPAPELEHLHQVSKRILSGSEPHSTSAFRYLKAAGVTTIVSVDGAKPPVAAAKAEGLRYVHIPIGYDGIPENAKLSLLRVLRDTEGGIYIHCHHGKHRGPAAAAMACQLEGSVDRDRALQILKQAGTSPDYAGLWRDIREFEMPPADAKLPKLVETANVESMASAMAVLSRHFDNLKSIQQADWKTPAKHPDLVPVEEALLVAENLHEANRNLAHGYDQQFRDWLEESETQAQRLHVAVKAGDSTAADRVMKLLKQNCRQCHEAYRN